MLNCVIKFECYKNVTILCAYSTICNLDLNLVSQINNSIKF
nr:MAG TPA: hypothetical protein [Bacteriophage sp.]